MIELQVPTKKIMIDILDGLIEKRYSREEAVQWRHDVIKKYNYTDSSVNPVPLKVQDGYWEFASFTILTKRGVPEDNNDYFVRDEDLIEYSNVLKQIDCTESNGEIKRIRPHQIQSNIDHLFLIEYIDIDQDTIRKAGVLFNRGIFENFGLCLESAIIEFQGSTYIFSFYHDHIKGHMYIEGIPENKENLASLLCHIGVTSSSITWVNELVDTEKCELYRIDDNGNNFPMGFYDSYIKAETMKFKFESKKHKQTYFLKRNLTNS
ncbi:MAG: hypothetical protein GY754_12870 [bacterium]|nr:hypothetical protein [bacterium]